MNHSQKFNAEGKSILSDLEQSGYAERTCDCCGGLNVFTVPSRHSVRHCQSKGGSRVQLLDPHGAEVLGRWGKDLGAAFHRFLMSLNETFPGSWNAVDREPLVRKEGDDQ
jgi:hypothetical protein